MEDFLRNIGQEEHVSHNRSMTESFGDMFGKFSRENPKAFGAGSQDKMRANNRVGISQLELLLARVSNESADLTSRLQEVKAYELTEADRFLIDHTQISNRIADAFRIPRPVARTLEDQRWLKEMRIIARTRKEVDTSKGEDKKNTIKLKDKNSTEKNPHIPLPHLDVSLHDGFIEEDFELELRRVISALGLSQHIEIHIEREQVTLWPNVTIEGDIESLDTSRITSIFVLYKPRKSIYDPPTQTELLGAYVHDRKDCIQQAITNLSLLGINMNTPSAISVSDTLRRTAHTFS